MRMDHKNENYNMFDLIAYRIKFTSHPKVCEAIRSAVVPINPDDTLALRSRPFPFYPSAVAELLLLCV
jgi:hypothetical protein